MGPPFHLQPWADFRQMHHNLDQVQPGRIILCMLRKDFLHGIPEDSRSYLQRQGSLAIKFLGRGMTWTWIWIKGGITISEAVTMPTLPRIAPRHLVNLQLDLQKPEEYCPQWPQDTKWEKRRKFCNSYEYFGDLCSCEEPNPLLFKHVKVVRGEQSY
ncbi:hypothetical protein SK128_009605 [Halocaridina rubra]|uniref:Uncharacterized protein n=1 Tax=Halocaridina rubra TaxID=373956 RepID=A0AAN8XEN3_HALRR